MVRSCSLVLVLLSFACGQEATPAPQATPPAKAPAAPQQPEPKAEPVKEAPKAEPPLKPSQPNQSTNVPRATSETLCGRKLRSSRSLRRPSTQE